MFVMIACIEDIATLYDRGKTILSSFNEAFHKAYSKHEIQPFLE